MTTLQSVLSALIQNGKVTVETPDLDMDELRKAVRGRAEDTLEEIEGIVCEESANIKSRGNLQKNAEKMEEIKRHNKKAATEAPA